VQLRPNLCEQRLNQLALLRLLLLCTRRQALLKLLLLLCACVRPNA
jgi:hypothetical protein